MRKTQGGLNSGQSRSFLQGTLDSLATQIVILDEEGAIIAENRAWSSFAEKNEVALPPTDKKYNYLDVCDKSAAQGSADAAAVSQAIRDILAGREEYFELEYPCHSPDTERWFVVRVTHFLMDGRVHAVVAHEDVTSRKKIEETLRERKRHFRLFSESTGDCFWNWDMVAGTVERSINFKRVFGYVQSEIEPTLEWWSDRIHADDRARVLPTFEKAVASQDSTCGYEYRFRCRDGSYAVVEDHVCLIRDDTGNVVRSLGAMRDITGRKHAEELFNATQTALSEVTGDELFLTVITLLTQTMGMTAASIAEVSEGSDLRIQIVAHNDKELEASGLEFDLTGTPCGTVVGNTYQVYRGKLWKQFPTHEYLKTHRIRYYAGMPLFSRDGAPIGVLCAMSDKEPPKWFDPRPVLTLLAARCAAEIERRRTTDTIQLQQVALSHAFRVSTVGELTAGIIHDLSQPLYSVSNFAGACARTVERVALDGSAEVTDHINQISDANRTAIEILNRLRRFLQPHDAPRAAIQLNTVIDDVLQLLSFQIRKHKCIVDCQLATDATILANAVQLQQVFVNLIVNACEAQDHLPAGDRRIWIRSSMVESELEITVKDNGPGIAEDTVPRLFEPFFTTKPSGMGMGMAITEGIIGQHDGKIWCRSQPQGGAVFHIRLPIVEVE